METNETPFKILVIASPKGVRYTQSRLLREDNIAVDIAKFSDLSVVLTENGPTVYCRGKSVAGYNYVWIQSSGTTKDVAYLLSLHLDSHEIAHTSCETEITKLVDMYLLSLNKVSIPKTYFYSRSRMAVKLEHIVEKLGYPFLLKSTVGSGGSDVHNITSAKDFFDIVAELPESKKYVCQEFIPNQFDYRLLVGNGVVLSGEKRVRQNDLYRNNAALGAQEIFLDLKEIPSEVKKLAIKATKISQLQWAGIDIVTNEITGKHYILEVNRRPGLTRGSPEIKAAMTFLRDIKKSYSN